jgi:hypothetical protein
MRSGSSFEGEVAEVDVSLDDAFAESRNYLTIKSRTGHRFLLVGRTA